MNVEVDQLLEALSEIHRAFGAPGDFGYETKEGRALFALYRAEANFRRVISALEGAK